MDGKDKEMPGGGALGGVLGGAPSGPQRAVAEVALCGPLFGHESDHGETIRHAYYEIREAASASTKLSVDHINPDGAETGSPENIIDDINGVPDIVVVDSTSANLIVEVETPESLKSEPRHIVEQLDDFRTQGFKRVLVVSDGVIYQVGEWAEEQRNRCYRGETNYQIPRNNSERL